MALWRVTIGPTYTFAIAGLILAADRHWFHVPNPGAITFLAVAFSAYLGGMLSGLVSSAISIGLAVVMFSLPGQPLHYSPDNFNRLLVLVVCTPAFTVLIGLLQQRLQKALERERAANRELEPLRAALDQSEVGVVLLDEDMRAQFVNRAFRKVWQMPDELADRKPLLAELMAHGRESKAHAVPADQLESYLAERIALVRAGDERPVDMRLADGGVVRCRCKPLTDGGRMLTYGNVGDLVRSADEFAEMAMRDALTGIYNRRHFMTRFDREWKRYRRYGRPLSLLVLDIDHFKSVNDRFGHDAGDQVIAHVAQMCGAQTRDSDVAARVGGEEFAILLPETDLAQACKVAERLRSAIAACPLTCASDNIAVTVSIGVALAEPAMADSAEMMKCADTALYASKHAGRNRVTCAPERLRKAS